MEVIRPEEISPKKVEGDEKVKKEIRKIF